MNDGSCYILYYNSPVSMIPQYRSNNFMSRPPNQNLTVHIFGNMEPSPIQDQLIDALDKQKYTYQIHIDFDHFEQVLRNESNQPTLVFIQNGTEDLMNSIINPKFVNWQPQNNVRIYTFPKAIPGISAENKSTLREIQEVLEAKPGKQEKPVKSTKLVSSSRGAIKLSGVHSIDKRNKSPKSVKKINTNTDRYYQIKYYKNEYFEANNSSLYDKLTKIFQKNEAFLSFVDIKETIDRISKKLDKKYLIIAPMRMGNDIKDRIKNRENMNNIDVILIGPLENNSYYLEKNVVLATNHPQKVYEYLKNKGIAYSQYMFNLFEDLINQVNGVGIIAVPYANTTSPIYLPQKQVHVKEVHIQNNQIAMKGSGQDNEWNHQNPVMENTKGEYELQNKGNFKVQVQHADQKEVINGITAINSPSIIYQDGESKQHRIKKMKSPLKVRPSEPQNNSINTDLNTAIKPPVYQKPSDYEYYNVKAQPPLPSSNIKYPQASKSYQSFHTYNSHNETGNAHNIYSTKNSQQHQQTTKLKNPSLIIQETSEQYRGSAKESIVNLEPEGKSRHIASNETTVPYEESHQKKFVNTRLQNRPEIAYIHGHEVKDENISRYTTVSSPRSPVHTVQSNRVQSNTNIHRSHYPINGNYQFPAKVVRMEEIAKPEQVKNQSSEHIVQKQVTSLLYTQPISTQTHQAKNYISGVAQNSHTTYNSNRSPTSYGSYPTTTINTYNQHTITTTSNVKNEGNAQDYKSSVYRPGANDRNSYGEQQHIYEGQRNHIVSPERIPTTTTYEARPYQYNPVSSTSISGNITHGGGRLPVSTVNTGRLNLQGYERTERDGRIVYVRKATEPIASHVSPVKIYQPTSPPSSNEQTKRDNSPKVVKYDAQPRRQIQPIRYGLNQGQRYNLNNYNTPSQQSIKQHYQKVTTDYRSIPGNALNIENVGPTYSKPGYQRYEHGGERKVHSQNEEVAIVAHPY